MEDNLERMSYRSKILFLFHKHKTWERVYQQFYYTILKRHIYAITSSMRVLPDFIIIGVVRGGTTSLYHYLGQHPCIARAAYDELGFFDSNFHLGLNWYRSLFPTKTYAKYVKWRRKYFMTYDVTPFYIYNPKAAQRIHQTLPNIKLITTLRNPVDRAYSNYHLGVRSGDERRTFEEVVMADLKKIQNAENMPRDNAYFEQIISGSYLARGFYAEQLSIWFKLFPKDNILVVSSEDLATKTDETVIAVVDFLKLPHYKIRDLERKNKAEYPPMDSQIRKMLIEYFKPHNEKLYSMLGRKFDWDR